MSDLTTTDELIAAAYAADGDGDAYGEVIRAVQNTDDRGVFDRACALTRSPDPKNREIGVDVIAQFGRVVPWPDDPAVLTRDHPFPDAAADVMLVLLASERESSVLVSLGHGFGHLKDPRAVGPLASLRDHADEDVRWAVVMGLQSHEDDAAVAALIELSSDEDSDVRDWATFGLGSQVDLDTHEIRAALLARLDDPDDDTRSEGLYGLAERGDPRAIEPLVAHCEDYHGPAVDEALCRLAAQTGDERLRPLVLALWEEAARRGTPLSPDRDDADERLVAAAKRFGLG